MTVSRCRSVGDIQNEAFPEEPYPPACDALSSNPEPASSIAYSTQTLVSYLAHDLP